MDPDAHLRLLLCNATEDAPIDRTVSRIASVRYFQVTIFDDLPVRRVQSAPSLSIVHLHPRMRRTFAQEQSADVTCRNAQLPQTGNQNMGIILTDTLPQPESCSGCRIDVRGPRRIGQPGMHLFGQRDSRWPNTLPTYIERSQELCHLVRQGRQWRSIHIQRLDNTRNAIGCLLPDNSLTDTVKEGMGLQNRATHKGVAEGIASLHPAFVRIDLKSFVDYALCCEAIWPTPELEKMVCYRYGKPD